MPDRDLVYRLVAFEQVVANLKALAINFPIEIVRRKEACDLGDRHAVDQDRT